MTRLGLLVGEENWTHFRDVADDLSSHYRISVYRPRVFRSPILNGRLNAWSRRSALREMLRSNDVCFFEWASDLLMTASRLPRKAAVVTRLHSFELYAWAPRVDWTSVDRVILLSEAIRRVFADTYPAHAAKAVVVSNGVSLERFTPEGRRGFAFSIGMLCAITPVKRVYEMVLTHSQLRRLGHPVHLHVGGSVPPGDERYAAAVHGLVRRLGLGESVTFHGPVADTPAWLRGIDIFVSNSYWEGQQVALLEAMASGCYCLSHGWLGADEVLPAANLYTTDAELIGQIVEYAGMSEAEQGRRQRELRDLACARFDIERTKRRIREELATATRD